MGGPTPYEPVGIEDDKDNNLHNPDGTSLMKRARVLCSYDAKDGTELNLTANEVRIFFYFFKKWIKFNNSFYFISF